MRVKVFKAADLKEAMAMVKDEMGRDAVILHTKRYRQGGFLGYKSKEVVEVTAALEDAPQRPEVKIPEVSRVQAPIRPVRPARSTRNSRTASSIPRMTTPQAPRQVLAQYKTAGTPEGVSLARSSVDFTDRVHQASSGIEDYFPQEESRGFVPMETEKMETRTVGNRAIEPQPIETVAPIKPVRAVPSVQQVSRSGQVQPPAMAPQTEHSFPYISQEYSAQAAQQFQQVQQPQQMQQPQQQIVPQGEIFRQQPAKQAEPYPQQAAGYEPEFTQPSVPKTEADSKIIKAETSEAVSKDKVQNEIKPDKGEEKIQALEDELAQMRLMLKQVMGQPRTESELVTLQDALKAQAVNEQVMQDIIRKISPAELLAPKDSEEALKSLGEYLHSAIKTGDGIGLKDGRPKIVALIGTTGVGKTTTIAKIAARFVLERGISVALITADTYRISAVDQLKTYSDIIGLPLEIVYSAAELKPALRKHKGKQLILIDTAGRSQNNDYQMQELKEFLAVDSSIEKHLVMSATTKEHDAEAIMDRFSICKPDRVIFTKTDETDSLGFIINLLYDRRIALSYLTNGQSVPDDIEPAKPEALAKLLLR